MGVFLCIRFKQLYRGMVGIGLFRLIFLILLITYLLFSLFTITKTETGSLYVSVACTLLVFVIHIRRKDKLFLKTCIHNHKKIYLGEYLALGSIILIFLIANTQWIPALILLGAIFVIPQIEIKAPNIKTLNTKIQSFIPKNCFEWKAGVRQTFFLFVPIWIVGLFTSFFIGSVPSTMLILGIIVSGFYIQNEPYEMIVAYQKNVRKFLSLKIGTHIFLFGIISLPLFLAFLVFHTDKWYIPIVEFLILTSIHTYLILNKYAFYESNRNSQAAQITGGMGLVSMFIPILLPVIWALYILLYLKSRKKLTIYLDDFN